MAARRTVAALGRLLGPVFSLSGAPGGTAFGKDLEPQRAGDRRGLDKPYGDRIAQAVGCRAADKGVGGFVVAEVFVAPDGARRDEAVGAGLVELDEQARARDARYVAVEGGADPVGEEVRDQPVGGLALGLHGAALGGGNAGGDFRQRTDVGALRQPVGAELLRADQGAMHDQVGVAADRRGEMRVAAQVEAEMAVILGRIFGLRLRAQHDLVDELFDVAAFDALRGCG